MSLASLFATGKMVLSCELFPPKTAKGERALYRHVEKLVQFDPDFITCTYGAGGSTRDKTLTIVAEVKKQFGVAVASHLTLVGSTEEDLRKYLGRAREYGVDYIVALRGDPPEGKAEFEQTAGGFRYANELVELIHRDFQNFDILVAGYPEKHREAPSIEADLENLKRKVDAGASVVVTQLFYDNTDFWRFRDRCRQIGITVPIIPGILPVTNLGQIQRITSLCGSQLPKKFVDRLSEKDDNEWQFEVGVEQAIAQTQDLIAHGVPGLHFYVLNRSDATSRILQATKPRTSA